MSKIIEDDPIINEEIIDNDFDNIDENSDEAQEEAAELEKEFQQESASDGKNYVSKALLLEELRKSREQDQLTPRAIEMFQLMVDRITAMKKYARKEEEQDCKATALLKICSYWRSFKPEKYENPNPFAYFSSVIANGLAEGWNTLHPETKKAPGTIYTSLDNNIYTL